MLTMKRTKRSDMATIKKTILLALAVLVMAGCGGVQRKEDGSVVLDRYYNEHSIDNPHVDVIDSCEYICWSYWMAHKGNCRFCKERRQKELKELVKQLKEK